MLRSALLLVSILAFAFPAAAQTPAVPKPTEQNMQDLMETVGLLSTLHLYQTYLNIGFIADGRAEELYDDAESKQLLGSVLTPLEKVSAQLDKIGKLATTKDDREAVEKLKKIATLLKQQGKELQDFWVSGKEQDGEKYEATRKKAWEEIRVLVGDSK